MKKILIVDDSKVTLSLLETDIKKELKDIEVLTAENYKDALKIILKYGKLIDIAVIDLHLPDSKDGAMIDVVESNGIRSIVLSGTLDNWSKEIIFGKENIVACVAKNGKKSIKRVLSTINRELQNIGKNVLVINNSQEQHLPIKRVLHKLNLHMIEVSNTQEALDIIKHSGKKIPLVLTCSNLPVVDNMDFIFKLREHFDKDELGLIVITQENKSEISSQFFKIGANDCISKPFTEQDIISRINLNLDLIDLFDKTKHMINRDFLTGAYNRRYFFEFVNFRAKKIKRNNQKIAIAMLDIDRFKNINDTYGHLIGDKAICHVVDNITKHIRESDLVARFGGEEFSIMIDDISYDNLEKLFEKIRISFQNEILHTKNGDIKLTVSIGIYYGEVKDLEEMIKKADDALYNCKNNGRNQIEITT
jgi:diguanylate cyclase (GGDEF)-like protein